MKKKLLVMATSLLAASCVMGQQSTNVSDIAKSALKSKDIVVIPAIKYDLTTKNFGYGLVGLYNVTSNFWTGLRVDRINGLQTTAGVQAQLQTDMTFAGITLHPFLETSVGIGQSALYGSAGTGAYIMLYEHSWTRSNGSSIDLRLGLIADYEHVVQAGTKNDNSNQLNGGPLINLRF